MENKKLLTELQFLEEGDLSRPTGWLLRHGKFFSTVNTYIIIAILITGAKVMVVWSFNKNQICYFFGTFKSDQTKGSSYVSHKIWIKRSYHKKIQPKITTLATKTKNHKIIQHGWSLKSVSNWFLLLLWFSASWFLLLLCFQAQSSQQNTQDWNRGNA